MCFFHFFEPVASGPDALSISDAGESGAVFTALVRGAKKQFVG